jgi:hypothetical protein
MASLETLRGIAALFCRVDQTGGGAVEVVTQQLRGLHQRGALCPSKSGGPRGAWLFNLHEACRARLLLEMIDLGLSGAALD